MKLISHRMSPPQQIISGTFVLLTRGGLYVKTDGPVQMLPHLLTLGL